MSDYNFQTNIVFFVTISFFTLTNSEDPDERPHFIWVFTVCKSTHLGVTRIQRVKHVFTSKVENSVYPEQLPSEEAS